MRSGPRRRACRQPRAVLLRTGVPWPRGSPQRRPARRCGYEWECPCPCEWGTVGWYWFDTLPETHFPNALLLLVFVPYFSLKGSTPMESRSAAHSFAAFFVAEISCLSSLCIFFSRAFAFLDTHLPNAFLPFLF